MQREQSDDTVQQTYKQQKVIAEKQRNYHLSLKEIAAIVGCSYSHARKVWARHQKEVIHFRGSPRSPNADVLCHNTWISTAVTEKMIRELPLEISKNRNKQRVWKGKHQTAVFFENGTFGVYPLSRKWKKELRGFLCKFWNSGIVDDVIADLSPNPDIHINIKKPEVPTSFGVRVHELFDFVEDGSHVGYKEFKLHPKFLERLKKIDRMEQRLSRLELFAEKQLQYSEKQVQLQERQIQATEKMTEVLEGLSQPRSPAKDNRMVI